MHIKPRITKDWGHVIVESPHSQEYVNAIKYCIHKQYRSFESLSRVWKVDARYFECMVTLVKAYFGSFIDSTGGVSSQQATDWKERWEVFKTMEHTRQTHEQQSGWNPRTRKSTSHGPFGVLYVTPNAPKEVIKAAYRVLAQLYHPDRGGDTALMQQLNAAYDELKQRGSV